MAGRDMIAGGARVAEAERGTLTWLWFACTALLLAMPTLGLPADAAGWAAIAVAVVLGLSSPRIRGDGRLAVVVMAAVLAHALVAAINAYVGMTLGGDMDALGFHRWGERVANSLELEWTFRIGADLYGEVLGQIYRAFGVSVLLGNAVTVLAFTGICLAFAYLLDELGVKRKAGVMLIVGLLPSGIMFLSVTLREVFQILAIVLAASAILRMRRIRTIRSAALVVGAALLLSVMHTGLPIYGGFLTVVGLGWGAGGRGAMHGGRAIGFVLGVILVAFVVSRSSGASTTIDAISSGQAFEYADQYRRAGISENARSTYGIHLDSSSSLMFAVTAPAVFVQYMIAPFPWQIQNLLDVYAFAESLLRLALVVFAWKAWRRAQGEARSRHFVLLVLFFGLEVLWSLGTVNWGTSIRHHLVGMPLLVALGGPSLIERLQTTARRPAPQSAWPRAR